MRITIGLVLPFLLALPAGALGQESEKPQVACTLPTLTAVAREIGGDMFEYLSLSKPDQDPHFVSATPSLMRKASEAQLLIEVGMQLELWADQVADGSGNPRIFRGAKGRIITATKVPKEEIPTVLTRAEGDIHPEGNPHVWLDPVRAKMLGEEIARGMQGVLPEAREQLRQNYEAFCHRIDVALFGEELLKLVGSNKLSRLVLDGALFQFLENKKFRGEKLMTRLGGWLKKAERLRGARIVEFHRCWVYFCKTFGIEIIGTIEMRPGIPPGPEHQREVTELIPREGVKIILVDNFYNPSLPRAIAEETGARVLVVPSQVGGEAGVQTYFELVDYLLNQLLGAVD